MGRWKPGDVAMVTTSTLGTRLGIRRDTGGWTLVGGGYAYDGTHGLGVRPLLVIDPESDDDLERLWRAVVATGCNATPGDLGRALRSLLAPPKPVEPQGLGAVVVDSAGDRWVLVYDHSMWQRADDRNVWRLREKVDAVKVLSDGVTEDGTR